MQVYSVDQIIDMGIKVAQKFKELNATITNYDGRVTGLEQTDADTELRLVELESNAGGSGEVDINALKPDILKIIRAELEWYGVERSEYAGTGWYKDANTGTVYCKDIPNGEVKVFAGDPKRYISIHDLGTLPSFQGLYDVIATSNLTVIDGLAIAATVIPIHTDTWDVSNAKAITNLFGAGTVVPDISKWQTGNLENATRLFGRFRSTEAGMTVLDLNGWDLSKLTHADAMFKDVNAFGNVSLLIDKWDMSNVVSAKSMFEYAFFTYNNTEIDISKWDLGKLKYADKMFASASLPAASKLTDWDVRSLETASKMFSRNTSPMMTATDFSGWRVGSVTNMDYMFDQSTANSDLSNWCVSNITSKPTGFTGSADMIDPVWGTCPYLGYGWYKDPETGIVECNDVENGDTHKFDGDPKTYVCYHNITDAEADPSNAATSNITSMMAVFINRNDIAGLDLSHWDVSNVTNMNLAFRTSNFDGDLSNWKATLIPAKPIQFLSGTPIENDLSKHPQWGAQ